HVVEYNPDDLTVTVEAGATMEALTARVGARRQLLPLDPGGVERRTLGGLAATNASGPLRARYGTLRDLLLGVRFVQADGVVTWGGAKVVKSVSGYDVPKLMVGALGTLGVLGELTLRLHPMPEFEATWLASFEDLAVAQAFVARLIDSTVQPTRVEILNRAGLRGRGGGDHGRGCTRRPERRVSGSGASRGQEDRRAPARARRADRRQRAHPPGAGRGACRRGSVGTGRAGRVRPDARPQGRVRRQA